MLDGVSTPVLDLDDSTITDGYHNLSHHGRADGERKQLKAIGEWHMKLLGKLYANLKSVREEEDTLLDRTMVLYGSNFGHAKSHVTMNMTTLLAGGRFWRAQHLAFDRTRNYLLQTLFVSMLQRLGIEHEQFASSSGTMRGLEVV